MADINYVSSNAEEDPCSTGVYEDYVSCITTRGSFTETSLKEPGNDNSVDPLLVDAKDTLIHPISNGNGVEESSSFSFASPSSDFNSFFNEDEDYSEWCESEALGIKLVRKGRKFILSYDFKTYVCDFNDHSIDLYKPGNKCFFTKDEKCFIRHCYDDIRDHCDISNKKDISTIIFTAVYNYSKFCDSGDAISSAIQRIHQSFLSSGLSVVYKDYKNILRLVYNLSRYDSFKVEFDKVIDWMNNHLHYCNISRAFDIVYCAYYTTGYDFGSLSSFKDTVYRSVVDDIRSRVRDVKKIPSPKSVQFGIGIRHLS